MGNDMYTVIARSLSLSRIVRKAGSSFAAAALALLVAGPALAEVAQTPLYLGGGNVPGNLVLVPSVEWPTINSVANLGEYDPDRTYVGYFDSNKCYAYQHSSTAANRHFYPVGWATNHTCSGYWSGNFMNWAATQTIDPFRKVLTGGLRARDTSSETWLEKARHDGQGGTGIYPNRSIHKDSIIDGAVPFTWAGDFYMQIQDLGNEMRFRLDSSDTSQNVKNWDGVIGNVKNGETYEVTIRVKVCVPGMLESNCRAYPNGNYKPEGLIQQYADELRFSIFGYLNDHDMERDGGVLRARQKFVGQTRIVPDVGETTNPNSEWDPDTGVFYTNPDSSDASATASALGVTISNSGVINYLNKFGQLTSNDHKNYDPVSELYYTALRYLKNQGNVPEYSKVPGDTGVDETMAADGFPVITTWDDPIQYACQKNVILGIGDVYTHRDKNLPGSSSSSEEPSMPSAVSEDDTVDVVKETAKVAAMEGITINTPFTGRNNSAYMVGLAWDAHTRDIRPEDELPGMQTVSTHWVDVLEAQSLEPPERNQYYLAAKYGGFRVPEDFDPEAHSGALDLDWWHSNGEILSSFGRGANPSVVTFPRPDNYYVAGEAHLMVESLTAAFARISAEVRSSASSVAANSTRLDSDTAVFQAAFDSSKWSGELQAFRINTDGTIAENPTWKASERLDALTEGQIGSRNILTITPPTTQGDGSLRSTSGRDFTWANLATAQQDLLRTNPGGGTLLSTSVGQDRLDWLRGSRVKEQPSGLLRQRASRLGDIVNSDPQFVHKQDFGYMLLAQSEAFKGTGIGEAYKTFRESSAYQSRVPMVVVGANDGMLHGFDATISSSGGAELFAYVPNGVYENLYELTMPEYSHRFYVDASPRVADAYFNGGWHTIVVGATGAGGKSVFALDVSDPSGMSSSSVLWEFTHPEMGYTIGQPAVAPLPNGEFGVVVTSGYETGASDGHVWILDPADGSIIKTITVTGSGDLGSPLVTDLNGDRVADRIYVGDSEGNLWRFDLSTNNLSNWGPPNDLKSGSTPIPLFVARDANGTRQAITAPLASAFNDNGLHTIFFGTGSFYRVDDNVVPSDPDVDSFYAIIDRGKQITSRTELLQQEIVVETTVNGIPVRAVSSYDMTSAHSGWFLDLVPPSGDATGERVVARATVRGDRVIFPTLIPNADPCSFGGESWIMELSTFTGGRLEYAVFDLNSDVHFDDNDFITITEDGKEVKVPVSGVRPGDAIVKTPAIIDGVDLDPSDGDPTKHEVKIVAGSDGGLVRIAERGSVGVGRQSWRQLR
jgi:type IV pilus assembly protein PilY1